MKSTIQPNFKNKKAFIVAIMAIAIAVGLGSCSKCDLCTKTNSPEIRVCQKDYNTKTEYNTTLDGYEADGYVCKGSI